MPVIDPNETLEQEITAGLSELRGLLANCSTYSMQGGACAPHAYITRHSLGRTFDFSGQAGFPFLLGVLLSGPEPTHPGDFGKAEWERAKSILERLFHAYMLLYMPTKEQVGALAPGVASSAEVSMLAFLHYFNTGLLASAHQIVDRIKIYLVPFDAELSGTIGISASQALAICQWIADRLQKSLDDLQDSADAERRATTRDSRKGKERKVVARRLKGGSAGAGLTWRKPKNCSLG